MAHQLAPAVRLFEATTSTRIHTAPSKGPSEQLDYTIDYTAVLEEDELIDSSSWTVSGEDAALTTGTGDFDDTFGPVDAETSATVWLDAGTRNVVYTVTNTVVTDNVPPRTIIRAFTVTVAAP
jgi:hypothetical protein